MVSASSRENGNRGNVCNDCGAASRASASLDEPDAVDEPDAFGEFEALAEVDALGEVGALGEVDALAAPGAFDDPDAFVELEALGEVGALDEAAGFAEPGAFDEFEALAEVDAIGEVDALGEAEPFDEACSPGLAFAAAVTSAAGPDARRAMTARGSSARKTGSARTSARTVAGAVADADACVGVALVRCRSSARIDADGSAITSAWPPSAHDAPPAPHGRAKSSVPTRAVTGSAENGTPASAPSATNATRRAVTAPNGARTSDARREASRAHCRSAVAIRA